MAKEFCYRIDLICVNKDNSIEVQDVDLKGLCPHTFCYRLYETYEENVQRLLRRVYSFLPEEEALTPEIQELLSQKGIHFPEDFGFTARLQSYLDERKSYYGQVAKYRELVHEIESFSIPEHTKAVAIYKLNQALDILYPYHEKEQ